ncbi:MAG: DUF389 domain-containing protein [Bacteroidales bacterium]|nr:DUF389 domain-containing protein [Bacteroidales bacterium]
MVMLDRLKARVRYYANLHEHMDTVDAAERIKKAIWFRGPNVYILAFSIIIASVGLNVNSTAVIIGAMLISPLMGPIIGMGMALGTNDTALLRDSLRNLLVMVFISLVVSTLFFLLSPLSLLNPTELEARTSPTIYDVLIAFFGGLAGIFENSRKDRGTVLSGVAIATALMPPLCTAGYGIAHWNAHYFIGAMYLFLINGVFIIIATYFMVKYLRFKTVAGIDEKTARNRRNLITAVMVIMTAPSMYTAFTLVFDNNFERKVEAFVAENRIVGSSYIYDYDIVKEKGKRKVELYVAGEAPNKEQMDKLLASATENGIKPGIIRLNSHTIGLTQDYLDNMLEAVYENTSVELEEKDKRLEALEARLDSLESLLFVADTTAIDEPIL